MKQQPSSQVYRNPSQQKLDTYKEKLKASYCLAFTQYKEFLTVNSELNWGTIMILNFNTTYQIKQHQESNDQQTLPVESHSYSEHCKPIICSSSLERKKPYRMEWRLLRLFSPDTALHSQDKIQRPW